MEEPHKISSIAGMSKVLQIRWILFVLVVPLSFYVSFFGTIFMGFCPGIECLPHTYAWILLTPLLLLSIWSLRATAISAVVLLASHVFTEAVIYKGGLNADTLSGNDKALDIRMWIAVFLLVLSERLPSKIVGSNRHSD